jgi:hypothetical protein
MEQNLYLEELAAKIERQRAKVRALELEAEERRQSEKRYRNERVAKERRLRETERQQLFYQQEEQRHKDRQARDESTIQAHLRHKAAVAKDRQAQNEAARQASLYREAAKQEQSTRDRQSQEEADRRCKAAKQAQKTQDRLLREDTERQKLQRAIDIDQRQVQRSLLKDQYYQERVQRDFAGLEANIRHEAIACAQRLQQKSLSDGDILAFDGPVPSFLEAEYLYMRQASTNFPEEITPSIQMSCMKDYQRAISEASRRLPCGLCGGLFQEREVVNLSCQETNLLHFCEKTKSEPDCCAVKDNIVSVCKSCRSAVQKRAIPPLSAGNFVNCLFCQDYPPVLKNLNTVEEAFIARAHVIGMFLKLTSGAKRGISYRGSRGHCVAVRQDPSELLKILPAKRIQDHTTITVSWDRGTPPSDENLARFCSVNKAKVLQALLWLCAHNPVYKSVTIDYSMLDSWPDDHVPQEIRDAFIALGSEMESTQPIVTDEREGYVTSLQGGLFENDLDAEVEDAEPGSILSRSFFSDFHGQDIQSTPATLVSLQAILEEKDLGGQSSSRNDSSKSCSLTRLSYYPVY